VDNLNSGGDNSRCTTKAVKIFIKDIQQKLKAVVVKMVKCNMSSEIRIICRCAAKAAKSMVRCGVYLEIRDRCPQKAFKSFSVVG